MALATLQILFNGEILQTLPVDKPALSIGRMKENDIVINNLAVSRFHAKVFLENGRIILEDQGSENGSFVNGKRIDRVELKPTDEIIIGKHQIRLTASNADETDPKVAYYFYENGDSSGPHFKKVNRPTESAPVAAPIAATGAPPTPEAELPKSNAWDASSTYAVDLATQEKILKAIQEKANAAAAAAIDKPRDGMPQPRPKLVIQRGGGTAHQVTVTRDVFCIGRALTADLVLDHPQVSRRHALIHHIGERYEIEDLDTGNGTYLNGEKIRRMILRPQDQITIGNDQLLFVLESAEPPPTNPLPTSPSPDVEAIPAPDAAPLPSLTIPIVEESFEIELEPPSVPEIAKPLPPVADLSEEELGLQNLDAIGTDDSALEVELELTPIAADDLLPDSPAAENPPTADPLTESSPLVSPSTTSSIEVQDLAIPAEISADPKSRQISISLHTGPLPEPLFEALAAYLASLPQNEISAETPNEFAVRLILKLSAKSSE